MGFEVPSPLMKVRLIRKKKDCVMFDAVFLEEFSIKRGINNIINMWY